jgi:hypothetical protein
MVNAEPAFLPWGPVVIYGAIALITFAIAAMEFDSSICRAMAIGILWGPLLIINVAKECFRELVRTIKS